MLYYPFNSTLPLKVYELTFPHFFLYISHAFLSPALHFLARSSQVIFSSYCKKQSHIVILSMFFLYFRMDISPLIKPNQSKVNEIKYCIHTTFPHFSLQSSQAFLSPALHFLARSSQVILSSYFEYKRFNHDLTQFLLARRKFLFSIIKYSFDVMSIVSR